MRSGRKDMAANKTRLLSRVKNLSAQTKSDDHTSKMPEGLVSFDDVVDTTSIIVEALQV
jgi:hypothetical protein